MNLGKSVSESDWDKYHFEFLKNEAIICDIFHWSYVPPPTMESNQERKPICPGGGGDTLPVYTC